MLSVLVLHERFAHNITDLVVCADRLDVEGLESVFFRIRYLLGAAFFFP